jgi:SpoVK/Ycf46/Vps4 family AAA+-type ATPase
MSNGKFKLLKKTSFQEIINGKVTELDESDLCFQSDDHIIQFEYEHTDGEHTKFEIKPGSYTLANSPGGVDLLKTTFKTYNLLESVDNTKHIINEAKTFFNKLNVYEQLGRPKKRAVLLYSAPGLGKTAAITKFCSDFATEDKGTVILNWPTSEVSSESVNRFLTLGSTYHADCTRVVLIIEDIGGGERDRGDASAVDSGLLNLLDGVGVAFQLPTFIVATTNHPEFLLASLADRPGRFDLMLELTPPTVTEKLELLKFIAKRELTEEEVKAISSDKTNEFSIAHLEEIIVRSLLHDKTIPQVIEEIIKHRAAFKNAFAKQKQLGIGMSRDDSDW